MQKSAGSQHHRLVHDKLVLPEPSNIVFSIKPTVAVRLCDVRPLGSSQNFVRVFVSVEGYILQRYEG